MRTARCLITLFVIFVLLAVTGCGGAISQRLYLRNNTAALSQPLSQVPSAMRFEVAPGTTARAIGQQLETDKLIADAALFEAYVRVNGHANQLAAGVFLLSPSMTIPEIVDVIRGGRTASVRITIPEGWRFGQILDHLRKEPLISEADVAAYERQIVSGELAEADYDAYPFLRSRPAGTSLEGYLFPDTYEVAVDADAVGAGNSAAQTNDEAAALVASAQYRPGLLTRQLDAFRSKVMPLYDEAIANADTELDLYTVLIIASIVEREAVIGDEKPAIAGVYLNRLQQGIKLEADPTVQYAMGYQPDRDQWWKTPVFLEEYSSVLSPYNTYLYPGLPPGPIANPGAESVRAVLYPEQHSFIYFVALPEENGRHVFAETFAEHQQNVDNYLFSKD